jgi:hypothetical protein
MTARDPLFKELAQNPDSLVVMSHASGCEFEHDGINAIESAATLIVLGHSFTASTCF